MRISVCVVGAVGALVASRALAGVFADSVVSYSAGSGANPAYTLSASVLGEPTRFTGVGVFPGAVTPFNPAYLENEVVQIGRGGSLVVKFDHAVTDDPANPYGIDLLVFGNSFFFDASYPSGIAAGLYSGGGRIEVSADGDEWKLIPGTAADGSFPTLGYSDLTDAYALSPGGVLSDFTRPVNPAFDPIGKTFAQISAAYAGSGGGTGIDLASVGLASAQYVRISTDLNSPTIPSIDGFSDVAAVPAPSGVALVLLGLARRARRGATCAL